MFGDFFNKITSALENIDGQAAISLIPNEPEIPIKEEFNSQKEKIDIDSLILTNQKNRIFITSLEEQLKTVHETNNHLEDEIKKNLEKNEYLTQSLNQIELVNTQLKNEIKSMELKNLQDNQFFEQKRTNLEDLVSKLEKEVSALSEQQNLLQHDLSIKNNENQKLLTEISTFKSEIQILEADIVKYREKAVLSLSSGIQDNNISSQLELLEAERLRLRDRFAKSQQKIIQLETSSKELEEQMQNEISEYRRQQNLLESELFKCRTQNEALIHELNLVRSQLLTTRESTENRYKSQLISERNDHQLEIKKIREQYSSQNSHSIEQRLIESNSIIESLKSEKAALLMMLNSNKISNNNDISIDIKKKNKNYISISTKFKSINQNFFKKFLLYIDKKILYIGKFLANSPIFRIFIFLWVVLVHFYFLFQ